MVLADKENIMTTTQEVADSRTSQIYEALRFDILENRLIPGERLKFIDLAKRFEISQTVVREALTRLFEQGLVSLSPKRGFSVSTVSVDDLMDLTKLRLQLEGSALRESILNGDLSWETAVVASHHTLERTPYANNSPDMANTWRQVHRHFHHTLCSACGSPRLERVVAQLRDSYDLYRIWASKLPEGAKRDIKAEHKSLVDAAIARKADLAVELLRDHITQTSALLLASAQGQNLR